MNNQSNPLIASLPGRSCDVLVIGGGVAGVCAAVAAARSGADTMLVERIGFLGGAATAAAVNQWMGWKTEAGKQIIAGLGQEMIDRLIARGGSNGFDWGILSTGLRIDRVVFDPEILKVVLDDMLSEAGVATLFHATASGAERQGRTITAVRFLTKGGELTVTPRIVIDTSGDLDVLHAVGCEMLPLEEGEELQPGSTYFKMGPLDLGPYDAMSAEERLAIARRGVAEGALGRLAISCFPVPGTQEAWFNVTRFPVDGTDPFALSRAEMEGRRMALAAAQFMAANVPGFEKGRLTGFATQVGIRETRRVRGRVVVTENDLRAGRQFDDAIAIAAFPIDVHETRGTATRLERVGGPNHHYSIPLGSLIPVSLDNALVAGRGISATHVAFGALRIMPQAMATGQAAGTAAALAATRNSPVGDLPFADIRDGLLKQGAILAAS
jgi:FAD dependent oxidoreductase